MNFSAIELTTIIENRLKNYYTNVKIDETGFVLSVGDGIARVFGLKGIQAGEMCRFSQANIFGMALNLEQDNIMAKIESIYWMGTTMDKISNNKTYTIIVNFDKNINRLRSKKLFIL